MTFLILKSGLALGALLGSTVPAAAAQANPPAAQATQQAQPTPPPAGPTKVRKIAPKIPAKDLVDMNKATKAELMKLPDVTAVLAAQVIAKRPYYSKEMLVSKGALPVPVWQEIRGLIIAAAPLPPKNNPVAKPKATAQP
jgi:hypothetical protein